MKNLLIDGDGVIYQICSGMEHEVRWNDEVHTLHSNMSDCLDGFHKYLENLNHLFDNWQGTFVFSSKSNFRKDIDPTYKGHRKKVRKPLAYGSLLEHIKSEYPFMEIEGLEADDVIGIYATNGEFKDPIIISDDKDMLTIPSRVYRLGTMYDISEKSANYHWLKQTLTGDTADGYKGCPGIGEKSAEKILDEDCSFNAVIKAFEKAKLTKEDAIRQAQLARILRSTDYDLEKNEVILWTPESTNHTVK